MFSTTAPAARHLIESPVKFECLTFALGDVEYGIAIDQVQELRSYQPVTRLANAPDHIKGVFNLRGTIVPVIDLRIQFALCTPRYDDSTAVIIVNIDGRTVGMVVDSVAEVLTLTPQQIKPVPPMGAAIGAYYLLGLGVLDARLLMLIDIARLLAASQAGLQHVLSA